MYKVSVVIPIYNVEKYIERCAESLFKQTLDDMQFIFVDDASPDESVRLLEQTLERFPLRKPHTIILHHARNMGLPTARATGMKYVEAPYVAHCDSDDYVEPTMYEKLYANATQNDSDMVMCGWKMHNIDGNEHSKFNKPLPKDSYVYNFLYGRIKPYVWPRLTKTDIYRKVIFPLEDYFEDGVQTAQLLTYASRISFIDDCLYHYARNPFSISNDRRSDIIEKKMRQCVTNYYWMHDFIVRHHPQIKEKMFALKKESIRFRFFPLIKRQQYLQTFPELNFTILFYQEFSWQHKVSHFLILLGLYPIVRATYRVIKKYWFDIRSKVVTVSTSVASTGMPVSRRHA